MPRWLDLQTPPYRSLDRAQKNRLLLLRAVLLVPRERAGREAAA